MFRSMCFGTLCHPTMMLNEGSTAVWNSYCHKHMRLIQLCRCLRQPPSVHARLIMHADSKLLFSASGGCLQCCTLLHMQAVMENYHYWKEIQAVHTRDSHTSGPSSIKEVASGSTPTTSAAGTAPNRLSKGQFVLSTVQSTAWHPGGPDSAKDGKRGFFRVLTASHNARFQAPKRAGVATTTANAVFAAEPRTGKPKPELVGDL